MRWRGWLIALGALLAGTPWTSLAAQDAGPLRLHVTLTQDSSPRGARAPGRALGKPARR